MAKQTTVNVRCERAEKERWKAAFDREGELMSEVCRKALEAFTARSERKHKAEASNDPA